MQPSTREGFFIVLSVLSHCWSILHSYRKEMREVIVCCLYVKVKVAQSCPTLCNPMDCSPPGSSVHGDSPGKNTGVDCHALFQGNLPNPGIEPRSPTLRADSLPAKPQGNPYIYLKCTQNMILQKGDK